MKLRLAFLLVAVLAITSVTARRRVAWSSDSETGETTRRTITTFRASCTAGSGCTRVTDDNDPFNTVGFIASRATGTRGFGLANARRIRTIFSTFQGLPRFRAATVGLTAETISGVAMGCRLLGVVEYQEGVGGPDGLDRNDTVVSMYRFGPAAGGVDFSDLTITRPEDDAEVKEWTIETHAPATGGAAAAIVTLTMRVANERIADRPVGPGRIKFDMEINDFPFQEVDSRLAIIAVVGHRSRMLVRDSDADSDAGASGEAAGEDLDELTFGADDEDDGDDAVGAIRWTREVELGSAAETAEVVARTWETFNPTGGLYDTIPTDPDARSGDSLSFVSWSVIATTPNRVFWDPEVGADDGEDSAASVAASIAVVVAAFAAVVALF